MKIEKFRIQGFKSITDLTVDNLSDINVFFGLNDVGKSNIFQALGLSFGVMKYEWLIAPSPDDSGIIGEGSLMLSIDELEQSFGTSLFQVGGDNKIQIEVEVLTEPVKFETLRKLILSFQIERQPGDQVKIKSNFRFSSTEDYSPDYFTELSWLHIDAERRLLQETFQSQPLPNQITDSSLKQALLYAYLSPQPEQKQRLEAIRKLLAEPPFELGLIDVALEAATNEINIGFIRPSGRLPIENLGSGPQQLLLLLGQIFFNESPMIAIEEPEMNLSPQYQEQMLHALQELIAQPEIGVKQLFISTHSPYLEFTENFYEVTMNEKGETIVEAASPERHVTHFAHISNGEDTGARLNSQNQVKLYERVIKDLQLKRGDQLFFIRNEQGRWELHHEEEVAQKLATTFDDQQDE